eukprot:582040-Pelagomonas_calceolata.AAC.2
MDPSFKAPSYGEPMQRSMQKTPDLGPQIAPSGNFRAFACASMQTLNMLITWPLQELSWHTNGPSSGRLFWYIVVIVGFSTGNTSESIQSSSRLSSCKYGEFDGGGHVKAG